MSSSRRKRDQLEAAVKAGELTDDDLAFLDAFCQDVEHDEISFEKWCGYHSSLDLSIPLFLSKEEACSGCVKTVSWTRCVIETAPQPRDSKRKIRISKEIEIPAGVIEGQQIILKGQGDQKDGSCGNLRIIIRYK